VTGAEILVGEDGCDDPLVVEWQYVRPFDVEDEDDLAEVLACWDQLLPASGARLVDLRDPPPEDDEA
jgi:hypothetical protein